MPHMYNHTEPNRVKTKATKKGMKKEEQAPKKKTAPQKKKKPMGMRKTNVSY